MLGDTPWQRLVDAVDRMVSDARQDMGQVGTQIDAVEFAGANERVHGGRPLAPAVGAGEEEIFSIEAHATQRILGEVVVYFQRAIITVQRQRASLIERVVDRLGRI